MDLSWMKELVPFITGLIGAWFGHRLTVKSKDRESLDEWWYRYSVTECMEPLLNYLNTTNVRMAHHVGSIYPPDALPIPATAAFRFVTITQSNEIFVLLDLSQHFAEHGAPREDLMEIGNVMAEVTVKILSLQAFLMDLKIERKSDSLFIHQNSFVRESGESIDNVIRNMKRLNPYQFPEDVKQKMKESVEHKWKSQETKSPTTE